MTDKNSFWRKAGEPSDSRTIFLVFTCLMVYGKLIGQHDWSWWVVLSPIWAPWLAAGIINGIAVKRWENFTGDKDKRL